MVRRASLAVEDVFVEPEDIRRALRVGFPRILILGPESEEEVVRLMPRVGPRLPILEVAPQDLQTLRHTKWSVATRQIDMDPARLRRMVEQVARPMNWVERILRELGQLAGRPLPLELRALVRRVLEFPSLYALTEEVAGRVGLTPGAMKARFRRRGLPSPFAYTVRLRALCACEFLSRKGHDDGFRSVPHGILEQRQLLPRVPEADRIETVGRCHPSGATGDEREFRGGSATGGATREVG